MAIDFSGGQIAFETLIDNFQKTISRTPVTKTISNITGDETLTEGIAADIIGAFFRKEDEYVQDKIGLLRNADAILMVKHDVTINKDDKLTYDSQDYRIDKVVIRRLNGTPFYQVAQCFRI